MTAFKMMSKQLKMRLIFLQQATCLDVKIVKYCANYLSTPNWAMETLYAYSSVSELRVPFILGLGTTSLET